MPEPDHGRFTPPRPRAPASSPAGWLLALVALALAGAWWWGWRPGAAPGAGPAAPVAAPAPAPAAAASQPARLHHPLDAVAEPDPALPPPAEAGERVRRELDALLGARQVADFLQVDGFVRRAVATVDNLARPQAPARLWPVQPTPGRFAVAGPADAPVQAIAADNAARYRAFVAFAEGVPLDAAVRLYARLYPLFQAAYEELGYPGRYFNDRLVEVLDQLLATPEPAAPLAVQLTRVGGEVPSLRPWVRYEYADPQLESLSSGAKLLLRMGPDNARRLKAVLAQLRQRVATGVRP